MRKNPGSTTVVVIPYGSTSSASVSMNPSRANFDAEYAEQKSTPTRPAVELMVMTWPLRCFRMIGRIARVTLSGPKKFVSICLRYCSGLISSKKPGVEVARVVDEHVDAAESLHGRLGRGVRGVLVGDVERDGEEVVVLADGVAHSVGVAAGRDDRVSGGECRLRDVDAHAAAGAGDEPHRVVSHVPVCLSLR